MKKIIAILFVLFVATGCSCSMMDSDIEPSSSPSTDPMTTQPTTTTDPEGETAYYTSDYIDYLANEYTLENPTALDNLDENVIDGYSFGLHDQTYYLVQLNPNNEMSNTWRNSIQSNGQIDVDIEGLPQSMYALLNGNYALISESNEYMDGFQDYYDGYSYENTSNNLNEAPNQ